MKVSKKNDLHILKEIPILSVADALGIVVRNNKALCFTGHDKRTKSLAFSQTTNRWKCFGACGLYGDTIELVAKCRGDKFTDAVNWLRSQFSVQEGVGAQQRNIQATRTKNPPKLEVARQGQPGASADVELMTWFVSRCAPVSSALGANYLKQHAIDSKTANRFKIVELRDPTRALKKTIDHWGASRLAQSGLAVIDQDGRPRRLIWSGYTLLIPFLRNRRVCYIQGRQFGRRAKFMSPKNLATPMFNASALVRRPRQSLVCVCEGIPDALALESRRIFSVAILGATAFKAEWVDALLPFEILVVPDADAGGRKFEQTIRAEFRRRGKSIRTTVLPDGEDISDFLATRALRELS